MNLKLYTLSLFFFITSCDSPAQRFYKMKPAFYSYIVADTNSNKVYAEHNSEVYVTPASCLKVVTGLLALKTLGINYQYETSLYVTDNDDILLKFSGDPNLSSEQLLDLLSPLKNKKISGKIILEGSIYQTPFYSTDHMIGDVGTSYAKPVSAINIDQNLIIVKARPLGLNSLVQAKDDVGYKIKSNIVTNQEPTKIKLVWDETSLTANGSINIEDKEIKLKISPTNHDFFIKRKFLKILKALNIEGKVEISRDKNKSYDRLKLLKTIKSAPLKDFLIPAMKESNNLVFDSLYLKIIHKYTPEEITEWSQGDKIIKELIKENFAIDLNKALIVDGSGLSRLNNLQPQQLLLILKQASSVPELIDSLSKPGEEGSLHANANLPTQLRGKTGFMYGISCLCGYGGINNSKSFVFIANSFSPPKSELNDVRDHFIKSYFRD